MLHGGALAIAGLLVSQAGYRRPIGIAGRSVSVWVRSAILLYPYPHMQHAHQVQQFKETVTQGEMHTKAQDTKDRVATAAITAAALLSNSSKDELSREPLPQRIIGPVKTEVGGPGQVAAVVGTAEGEAAADLLAGAALLFHTGVSILSTELHKRLGVFVPYYSQFGPLP
jgi:hypothetical protein